MTYVIRPATPADAARIAPLLREQDKIECVAASGSSPEVALPLAFTLPESRTIFAETKSGDPILIGGTSRYAPNVGVIWMLATTLLERYPKSFIKEGRAWIAEQHRTYPLLFNHTWAENDLHVRFLRFMGFSLIRNVAHNGTNFIEFARLQHV